MDLVSIIIPFYNEEQFLARAIQSAIAQSYESVEIILVNDGSVDNSRNIATEFRQSATNITLIDAVHHSLGKARNIGIAAARGKYVLFLDSDDELEHFAVACLVKKIEAENSDLVICKFGLYDASGQLQKIIGWNVAGTPMNSVDTITALYRSRIVYMAGARLYKLDTVRKYLFPEGIWFEDTPFLLACILHSEQVSFEARNCWKIHSRSGSITRRTIETKRIEDAWKIFLLELDLLKTSPYYESLKRYFFTYQVQPLMLNLIFLCSDQARLSDVRELEATFENRLADFTRHLKSEAARVGPRTKINLAILSLPRFAGWRFTYFVVPFLKRKQYRSIHVLRNT
jgi:glycosyltransferase involved in cell wall biosynthesis